MKLKNQKFISVFCVCITGYQGDEAVVVAEVIRTVRNDIGPICAFKSACVVPKLPKTRSGKIARPSLIDLAENRPLKVP
jgi:propionyl-CoA synthetase